MPKKCANCNGYITEGEDADHCVHCNVPYHEDCKPERCVRCKKSTY